MTSTVEPFSFLAGHEVLGASLDGWTLDEAPHGCDERVFRAHVRFIRPFRGAPLVHLGLAGFDAGTEDAARLTVTADNIGSRGFDLVLKTWLHSRLWRVDVNWLAVGS